MVLYPPPLTSPVVNGKLPIVNVPVSQSIEPTTRCDVSGGSGPRTFSFALMCSKSAPGSADTSPTMKLAPSTANTPNAALFVVMASPCLEEDDDKERQRR